MKRNVGIYRNLTVSFNIANKSDKEVVDYLIDYCEAEEKPISKLLKRIIKEFMIEQKTQKSTNT